MLPPISPRHSFIGAWAFDPGQDNLAGCRSFASTKLTVMLILVLPRFAVKWAGRMTAFMRGLDSMIIIVPFWQDMSMVIAIHNAVNEQTWQEILKYESLHKEAGSLGLTRVAEVSWLIGMLRGG